jgi:hypothetical protein
MQTNNFASFLNGYEMWSIALREEHKLQEFEKKTLRKIFEPNKDEIPKVIAEWLALLLQLAIFYAFFVQFA